MSTQITTLFDVTGWDAADPYDAPTEGPMLTQVAIRKAFRGDLEGESTGTGLFCGSADPEAGAGYVVSERFAGRLGERTGTFVIQHGGIVGPGVDARSFGNVVPGSGTGDLAGLTGDVEFAEGHTLTLTYELPGETD